MILNEKQIVPLPNGLKVHVERCISGPSFETVIFVNGALATTASFGQAIKDFSAYVNTVCYDLPYAGQSQRHNPGCSILTIDDEVEILLHLIKRFEPAYLTSVSWGGVAALLALARGCRSVRCATICSFSPFLNDAMVDYVTRGRDYVAAGENLKAAELLNDTVGRHLPSIIRLYNRRYLLPLLRDRKDQVAFHVNQILSIEPLRYASELANIRSEVLFINGALDKYTTSADVRKLAEYVPHAHFATIPGAGHFLDLEGPAQRKDMRAEIFRFYTHAGEYTPSPAVMMSS
jgi:rhamnosyltransferase subunit A